MNAPMTNNQLRNSRTQSCTPRPYTRLPWPVKAFLALLCLCGTAYGKDLGVDITLATVDGTVAARAKQVTFIFPVAFTGTVAGIAYNGANDASMTLKAPTGDTLTTISYTVSAGTLKIVRLQ